MPKINKFEISWKQLWRCSFKNLYTLDKFSHLKILVSRCKYKSLQNWPWFYKVVHNIFKNYITRLHFMLLNCVNFIISMGIGNFRKLLLSPKVKLNLFCTLSVDFGFREFRSFQSNSMAKGNLTNIAVT
jgi:hypothetical protein